jgi:hypothetical protein
VSSGLQDLSDFVVHPLVPCVFLFLRFSVVFTCDFRFVSFAPPFRKLLHGSISP